MFGPLVVEGKRCSGDRCYLSLTYIRAFRLSYLAVAAINMIAATGIDISRSLPCLCWLPHNFGGQFCLGVLFCSKIGVHFIVSEKE